MAKIGMLNEGALHAALKQDYLGESGLAEVPFGGFVADVVRDGVIYEVQTSSFSGLGRKMLALADLSPVVLVHPIPQAKIWSGCKTPKPASLRASPAQARCHRAHTARTRVSARYAQTPKFRG